MSSFVGRERELARGTKALRSSWVVTLTGVGGVGKTRLALQLAAEVLVEFKDGAWLVTSSSRPKTHRRSSRSVGASTGSRSPSSWRPRRSRP